MFNLYADHIIRNAGLDELQVGIKVGGKNINNLRYAGREKELKRLLMRVKEESGRVSLK